MHSGLRKQDAGSDAAVAVSPAQLSNQLWCAGERVPAAERISMLAIQLLGAAAAVAVPSQRRHASF